MADYLNFTFNINDPKFRTTTTVVNDSPTNYVSHTFIQTPIYNSSNIEIGYKASDDYIQQVDVNKYMIRINNTYYIDEQGTISWSYNFINNVPSVYYPAGALAASNITSTTGNYFGKKGIVALLPSENGYRNVTIVFNF